jgi:hypothetical protein
MEKTIIMEAKKTENFEQKPIKEEGVFFLPKRISREDKQKNINDNFKKEIGRELTQEEMREYLQLFERKKVNFWDYVKKIQDKDKV